MALLLRLFAWLPLPLAHALGVMSGWGSWLVPNPHRRIAKINISRCYPELSPAEQRRLLRKTLCEVGKTMFEAPILWFSSQRRFRRLVVESVGEEQLQSIGKGALIIGPHLGSWEMVNLYCSAHYPITSLYRPLRQPKLEPSVVPARERFGAKLVPTDARGVKALFSALKNGELVGIPPDQDPRKSGGVFAPFFGIEANTMTLLPRLAHKSGAKPLLTVAERLSWGRGFRLHFFAMPEAVNSDDQIASAKAINESVEQAVRRWPAQYQWIYKRFRTQPAGEPRFYRKPQ